MTVQRSMAAPVITLWTEDPVMTATEARAVAALLLREADRLEALRRRDCLGLSTSGR